MATQPQSICVLRLSAIGDVVHANAMVSQLRQRYPQAQITWIIGKVEYQLMRHCPGIEFVVFDKSQGWRAYLNLAKALKGKRFDVLLHMQLALRASIASLVIKANRRIGFDKARVKEGQQWVTNESVKPLQNAHVADGFMGFLQAIENDPEPLPATHWNIPIPSEDQNVAIGLIPNEAPVFVICPAASKAERNWLAERYAAMADYAVEQGYQVLLCGGPAPAEKVLAAEIESASRHSLTNLVGQTNLPQLLELLKRAQLVLAPDTGPLHMAVSQGTPVIGLYAHSNPRRTGPYRYRELTVSVYEQCIEAQTGKPWQAQRFGKRAKGEHLMAQITVERVKQAFDKAQALLDSPEKPANIDHSPN
ncbi:glycosyltransferase family 9 protein [Paraferrimonas sedimenticola]|uniref:Glycosyl transferase n=1 Tax=Paraferrimonas sedimenticola TaxID=375674 RepID=A0AA37RYA5_9GAMM|nr:glycosyltransferase family 9 protein [Paraferrimonas sedimenticola]GLP97534.1 glycosyl transferase [Paraferrimonas sedimenticola]